MNESENAGTLSRRAVVSAIGSGAAVLTGLRLGNRPPARAQPAAATRTLVRGGVRQYARPQITPGHQLVMQSGVTILGPAAQYTVPRDQLWPVVSCGSRAVDLAAMPPVGAASQAVTLSGFTGRGWYEIRGPQGQVVDRREWDAARMPHLRMHQEWGATRGFPYWGSFYTVRLEPVSPAA